MQQIVDHFLADLRLRYAECHAIDIAVAESDDQTRLIAAFQARRDGVIRRHVYTLGPPAKTDGEIRSALEQALETFRREIDSATRRPRKTSSG